MLAGNDADDDSNGSKCEGEDGLDLEDMFDNVPHDNSDLQGDDNLESQFSPSRDTPLAAAATTTMTTCNVEVHWDPDPDVSEFDSNLNTPHRTKTHVSVHLTLQSNHIA